MGDRIGELTWNWMVIPTSLETIRDLGNDRIDLYAASRTIGESGWLFVGTEVKGKIFI